MIRLTLHLHLDFLISGCGGDGDDDGVDDCDVDGCVHCWAGNRQRKNYDAISGLDSREICG